MAQRELPAHVVHEYCRPDRSFDPCPAINEPTLPRVLTFYNCITANNALWFPLSSSSVGLGVDFGLIRRMVLERAWGTSGPAKAML